MMGRAEEVDEGEGCLNELDRRRTVLSGLSFSSTSEDVEEEREEGGEGGGDGWRTRGAMMSADLPLEEKGRRRYDL
jgi:hypothetical protein